MRQLHMTLLTCALATLALACKKEEPPVPAAPATAASKTQPSTPTAMPPPGTHRGDKGRFGARRIAELTAAANLTPEQATQITSLLKAERKAIRESRKASPADNGAAARKATDDAVEKLLKPEQFAAYTKLRAEWKAKREERRNESKKRMADQLEEFATANKLKPEQVEQLKALLTSARQERRMGRGDMKDREARRAKRKEMRAAMLEKVKKILDAKQFAAYQEWRQKMRGEGKHRGGHRRGHRRGRHGDEGDRASE